MPLKFQLYLNELDLTKLYEVRLRTGFCVKVRASEKNITLGDKNLICEKVDIDEILKNVTERSVYAYNESIKKGFLTTKDGVRIGLAGECVYDNGKIITIKNVTSLNIRVPHLINGAASEIFNYVLNGNLNSSLIISPPFFGKTTILKDLVLMLNKTNKFNILVVDERNEFCFLNGENIDNIKYCDKDYAFSYGIRSMSPDVIVTDELSTENDWESVENAVLSGVKVLASCHSDDLENLRKKMFFKKGIFDLYILLKSEKGQFGQVEDVFDKEFNKI